MLILIERAHQRLTALLVLILAMLCCQSPALAHNDGAYWHDSGAAAHNPQWMLTLGRAKKLTGIKTTRQLVDYALQELLRHRRQRDILKLRGNVEWEGDLAKMRQGRSCE